MAALGAIDEVIVIIRHRRIMRRLPRSSRTCSDSPRSRRTPILNMRLAKLTALEQDERKGRLKELKALFKDLKEILKSEARKLEVMLEELDEIVEKYGDARRTVILEDDGSEEDGGRKRGRR